MNDSNDKLNSLLSYWLDHNREHGAEFREWAEKIGAGRKDVAEQLLKAAEKMAEVDACLERAHHLMK